MRAIRSELEKPSVSARNEADTARPQATVSVDLDPVDLHLRGYGWTGLDADTLVYREAAPRLLDLFARHGLRATFFVVGRDAPSQKALLRRIAACGHEIAGHSMTHPVGLERLAPAQLAFEIADSKRRIETATGLPVSGFRAPGFDLGPRAIAALQQAGYRYDASDYPTPLLLLARAALAVRSRRPGEALGQSLWPRSFSRLPGRMNGPGSLYEFPVSVTLSGRWPLYHTLRSEGDGASFGRRLDAIAGRGEPLSYILHAVDALGLVEDRVDARLAGHPGMRVPLVRKLALLDSTLGAIASRFDPSPFASRL
jgi:hypothetical protein